MLWKIIELNLVLFILYYCFVIDINCGEVDIRDGKWWFCDSFEILDRDLKI